MSKVLGILGSPRIGGNADILLDEFLKAARECGAETEKVIASRLKIAPCDETNYCWREGECNISDDMQRLYPVLLEADVLVISTPVFFAGAPAQLKALIDRTQAIWAKKYILKRKIADRRRAGFLIGVCGSSNKDTFSGLIQTIKAFFVSLDVEYKGELLFCGVDEKGDVAKKTPAALSEAYQAGIKFLKG